MSTRDGYVNPTWLDKEFMERALQEGNQDPCISVQDIKVRAATTVGENYASLMYRVLTKFITGSGKIEEKFFIVKGTLIPTSKEGENTLFETEIEMYSSILPKMADLYNELIHDEPIHFAANSIFYTKNPSHIIVLEDLGESSYQMSKRHQGLDLDHCKKVMSHLGKFHASSVVMSNNDTMFTNNLSISLWTKIQQKSGSLKIMFSNSVNLLARVVETWPEFGENYANELRAVISNKFSHLMKCFERNENGFNVLNHGDLWTNNIMFKYDEETSKVSDLRFVDFQLSFFGSPAIDLIYFFQTSPSIDVKESHLDDLLVVYHSSLEVALKRLGFAGKIWSLEELRNEVIKNEFYAVFVVAAMLPIILSKAEDTPDFMKMFKQNDEDTSHYSLEYKNEVKRVLPLLKEKGLFDF